MQSEQLNRFRLKHPEYSDITDEQLVKLPHYIYNSINELLLKVSQNIVKLSHKNK